MGGAWSLAAPTSETEFVYRQVTCHSWFGLPSVLKHACEWTSHENVGILVLLVQPVAQTSTEFYRTLAYPIHNGTGVFLANGMHSLYSRLPKARGLKVSLCTETRVV